MSENFARGERSARLLGELFGRALSGELGGLLGFRPAGLKHLLICALQAAGKWKLQTVNCKLQAASCKLQTASDEPAEN